MKTELAIDPAKRAEVQPKIDKILRENSEPLQPLRRLWQAREYKEDYAAQVLICQAMHDRYPNDSRTKTVLDDVKAKLAAQNQRTSSHSSAGSSPGAQSSADSNSSGELSRSSEEGHSPDRPRISEEEKRRRIAIVEEARIKFTQGAALAHQPVDVIEQKKEAAVTELKQVETILKSVGISTFADYEKLSNFQKNKKPTKGSKITIKDLMARKESLSKLIITCDEELKEPMSVWARLYTKAETLEKMTRDEIFAAAPKDFDILEQCCRLMPTVSNNSNAQFVVPQRAPAAQPQRVVGQPVGTAASINHAWMGQGQPQPRQSQPQQGKQSASELIRAAYGK